MHGIDWTRPWLRPWREPGQRLAQAVAGGLPLHEALNREARAPVRFVPQSELPPGMAYEHYIFESGCCPVRADLHDFFNGICWLGLPRTKQRLNALQAAQIAADGIGPKRGPVRDALTLFDENAALLQAPPPLWQALLDKDWHRLFVVLRPLWAEAELRVVGHAALEKLVFPRKQVTVHVWRSFRAIESGADLDDRLAASLAPAALAAKPFAPLPVLGIPGWWAENENFSFYDDSLVFRPPQGHNHPYNKADPAAGMT
ncbi:DUF3025 domain-containing protein [Variovorax terrae]|uniref:DUF3025 domain-containing protein n=1 Tax=Variovorax terrae TaxID=2923278 RepID=A0A9X1VRB2_9BURK|nr:DUF3025 domain-containing protein [Variovorax terrae]MCJ0761950.1 DUF3025 domain-containing protein [Variovorax terrae]